jgi:8-oxo-dGTP diphosphatase
MKFNSQAGTWAIIHCPSTGNFLFGRRSPLVNKPGLWNFFGGHIDAGEDPRGALMRELREETGFEVEGRDLVYFGGASGAGIQEIGYVEALRELHYFLLLTESEIEPRLNEEHSEFRWCKPAKLPRNVNRPTAIAINIGLIQKALLATG